MPASISAGPILQQTPLFCKFGRLALGSGILPLLTVALAELLHILSPQNIGRARGHWLQRAGRDQPPNIGGGTPVQQGRLISVEVSPSFSHRPIIPRPLRLHKGALSQGGNKQNTKKIDISAFYLVLPLRPHKGRCYH